MAPRKKPLPLTLKELKVLEYIEHYFQDQSMAPTFQEIKEHFGFASFNSVQRYLKQLQDKNYIHIPGGNQKRALQILNSSRSSISNLLANRISDTPASPTVQSTFPTQPNKKGAQLQSMSPPLSESLSLPLLGRVAAGSPIEAFTHDEHVEVPSSLIRNPSKTFALMVQGQSMVEDGILDGDIIFVQKQTYANNGETVVAMVNNQATVKRFYLHAKRKTDVHTNPQTHAHSSAEREIELRPANATMESMWFAPYSVDIQGIVVGLLRRY
jgi:repressor LexA